tara:strand:+ start:231 stop:380 length:150 start_codon:yes stop_codon:yes gene_type:complete
MNKQLKEIVMLWHETQSGHYLKCREKQLEFADIMWDLYEEIEDDKGEAG